MANIGILDFMKKLLPRLDRSAVAEDLRATLKELDKAVIPSYESGAEVIRVLKPEAIEVKNLQAVYAANTKGSRVTQNFIIDIAKKLANLRANAEMVADVLEKVVDKDIITQGMTTRAAFVIRAAGNISFVSRFMLSLLNYVYTKEAEAKDSALEDALLISPAECKFIEKNFLAFTKLFDRYSEDPESFRRMYDSILDVVVNDRTNRMLTSMLESKEADPMGSTGFSGFVGSPIYTIRLAFANWQNDRYESAKAKKQQLELRLLYLENQQKNRQDPALTQEIQRLQDRIEKLDYRLTETDKELDL